MWMWQHFPIQIDFFLKEATAGGGDYFLVKWFRFFVPCKDP